MNGLVLSLATINLPQRFDAEALEEVIGSVGPLPHDRSVIIDASRVGWADPAAAVGLRVFGETIASRRSRPGLIPPSGQAARESRAPWLHEADATFQLVTPLRGAAHSTTDTLLPPARIASVADVEMTVDSLWSTNGVAVARHLNFRGKDFADLVLVVTELLTNVVDHAKAAGWVAAWVVPDARSGFPRELVLAVADAGQGFRASQSAASDEDGLANAVVWGRSRFRDLGRGQGLKQIRSRVAGWGGEFNVRSGTARLVDRSPAAGMHFESNVPFFPGAQITVTIPPGR